MYEGGESEGGEGGSNNKKKKIKDRIDGNLANVL